MKQRKLTSNLNVLWIIFPQSGYLTSFRAARVNIFEPVISPERYWTGTPIGLGSHTISQKRVYQIYGTVTQCVKTDVPQGNLGTIPWKRFSGSVRPLSLEPSAKMRHYFLYLYNLHWIWFLYVENEILPLKLSLTIKDLQ